jgi:hypothetical protein
MVYIPPKVKIDLESKWGDNLSAKIFRVFCIMHSKKAPRAFANAEQDGVLLDKIPH